jgi:prevent-host-death family protein
VKKASAAEVKARFNSFLNESKTEPVVVMDDGKPVAVLMGIQDEEELQRLVFASSRRLQEILEAGRKEIREGRGIPNEEFWKQVGLERADDKKKRVKKKAVQHR